MITELIEQNAKEKGKLDHAKQQKSINVEESILANQTQTVPFVTEDLRCLEGLTEMLDELYFCSALANSILYRWWSVHYCDPDNQPQVSLLKEFALFLATDPNMLSPFSEIDLKYLEQLTETSLLVHKGLDQAHRTLNEWLLYRYPDPQKRPFLPVERDCKIYGANVSAVCRKKD